MIHYISLIFLLQRCGNGFESKIRYFFFLRYAKQYHVHIMPTTSVKKICSLKIYILFPLYCKIAFLWCNSCYWFVTE